MLSCASAAALRGIVLSSVLAASAGAVAQTVDLVDHNGFEACWSKALTKAQFLTAMDDAIGTSGSTLCIAQIDGSGTGFTYSACNTPACPGSQTGCPVTIHSPGFSGDFSTGAFTASGTADDVSIPVSYTLFSVPGSCTITVTGITMTYSPSYFITADGNNGDYMAYLTQSAFTIDNYSASSPTPFCETLATSFGPSFISQAEATAGTDLAALLDASTVGDSVCPLTP